MCINSLRRHDPDQVQRSARTTPSQPGQPGLPCMHPQCVTSPRATGRRAHSTLAAAHSLCVRQPRLAISLAGDPRCAAHRLGTQRGNEGGACCGRHHRAASQARPRADRRVARARLGYRAAPCRRLLFVLPDWADVNRKGNETSGEANLSWDTHSCPAISRTSFAASPSISACLSSPGAPTTLFYAVPRVTSCLTEVAARPRQRECQRAHRPVSERGWCGIAASVAAGSRRLEAPGSWGP
jgi:hypothetical protein